METYEQELFLKNMPKAIDSRIIRDQPLLAKAIAAEHLIQVRHLFTISSAVCLQLTLFTGVLHSRCEIG